MSTLTNVCMHNRSHSLTLLHSHTHSHTHTGGTAVAGVQSKLHMNSFTSESMSFEKGHSMCPDRGNTPSTPTTSDPLITVDT